MKIRLDFVTNSSSSSYLISIDKHFPAFPGTTDDSSRMTHLLMTMMEEIHTDIKSGSYEFGVDGSIDHLIYNEKLLIEYMMDSDPFADNHEDSMHHEDYAEKYNMIMKSLKNNKLVLAISVGYGEEDSNSMFGLLRRIELLKVIDEGC